jgi:hypothetical protein
MRAAKGNARSAEAAGLAQDTVLKWLQQRSEALRVRATWLADHAGVGFVRRCHGDLHLGNLCLRYGVPVPFDDWNSMKSWRQSTSATTSPSCWWASTGALTGPERRDVSKTSGSRDILHEVDLHVAIGPMSVRYQRLCDAPNATARVPAPPPPASQDTPPKLWLPPARRSFAKCSISRAPFATLALASAPWLGPSRSVRPAPARHPRPNDRAGADPTQSRCCRPPCANRALRAVTATQCREWDQSASMAAWNRRR